MISVIVPVYNVEKYLKRCIDSIIHQSYADFEVILIDDGSSDNSGLICDEYAKVYSNITVIHKENNGVSAARNTGLEAAKGEYIVFIDSDDRIAPRMLEFLAENTKENTLTVVNYTRNYSIFRSSDSSDIRKDVFKNNDLKTIRHGGFVWGILYSKNIIDKYDLRFDESTGIFEDVIWNAVYLQFVDEMLFIHTPLYFYRVNNASITGKSKGHLWQCECWIKAYCKILSTGTRINMKPSHSIRRELRVALNNIYDELRWSGRNNNYSTLKTMMQNAGLSKSNKDYIRTGFEPFGAYFFHKHALWMEYYLYSFLFFIKQRVLKRS